MRSKLIIFFKLLLMIIGLNEILATYSGLYVDNGHGQTVIERFMSRKEKIKFEREMLDILGLSRKPRKVYNSSELQTSAPKFLIDIYKSLDGSEVENEFNLKSEDIRSIEQSDAILTFMSHTDHVHNVRHEKGRRLWFDISDIPAGDTVVNAELRLYKEYSEEYEDTTNFTVTIYQVVFDLNGDKQLQFVDAENVTGDYEGWIVFNVSAPLLSWVAFPSINKGLYVYVHKHMRSVHEVHPENMGIITASSDLEGKTQQPFMVAFLKYGVNSLKNKVRRIRDTSSRRKKKYESSSYKSNPFIDSEPAWTLRNCQLQTLYVNFKDLNWHEWIIAPEGYAAYYCGGLCEFPLNAQMNATNHAVVQTLVHLLNPMDAPKACCVPTKLASIAVLYFVEDNNVILKKYRNMIAKSCGCH